MDSAFAQWALGQTGITGIAALSLFMLNRGYQDSLRRERENSEQNREDRKLLIGVLSETAKALSGLQGAVENLTHERRDGNARS